jgi:predicted CXXCH cytochrome family protein
MHALSADGPPNTDSAYSPQGADTCLGCHNNATVTGLFRTKHARPNDPRGPFGHGGLQCEACHGAGGAHVKAGGGPPAGMVDFGPKALATVAQQNANCLGCHQSNAAHDWASSAHAAGNVACASCHTLHEVKDPVQTAATQIEVCTSCHQAQHTDLFKTSHHPLHLLPFASRVDGAGAAGKEHRQRDLHELPCGIPRAVSLGTPTRHRRLHQLSRAARFGAIVASQDASAVSMPIVS